MSRAVILLKSPPRVLTTDAYVKHLEAAGYIPYFVEVLDSILSNAQELEDIIRAGPNHGTRFVGVVITSSRAADAWIQVLSKISEPGNPSMDMDCQLSEFISGDWSETPFYVVGESTGRTLKQITISHPVKFSESLILGASQTGSSESLAQFVLDDLPLRRASGKLLYLTGDKNKDTFRRIMAGNGVGIQELMVYETKAVSNLEERVASIAEEIANGEWDFCG